MTHPERVGDYLEHMAEAIERAIKYAGNVGSLDALEHDELAQDAIVRTIAVVGEAANRIQRVAPQFQDAHPELPWNQMLGGGVGHPANRFSAAIAADSILAEISIREPHSFDVDSRRVLPQ